MKAVFWKENGVYIGSLIDYDVVAQGIDLEQAKDSLDFAIKAERLIAKEHGMSFEDLPKPPDGFVSRLFESGEEIDGFGNLSVCRLAEMDFKGMQYMAWYLGTPIDILEACCYCEEIPVNDDGGY